LDLYFVEYTLLPVAKGFITPTSHPFFLESDAKEVATVVLPISVSVPVINIPFIKGNACVLVVINDKHYGLFKSEVPYRDLLRKLALHLAKK
jgi:hypothetical protein